MDGSGAEAGVTQEGRTLAHCASGVYLTCRVHIILITVHFDRYFICYQHVFGWCRSIHSAGRAASQVGGYFSRHDHAPRDW